MDKFNPNDVGVANGNFFGLPYSLEESEIILLPIPWDSTVSYGAGTSNGPEAIIIASTQVDLFDEFVQNAWETKIGTIPIDKQIISLNDECRKIAVKVIDSLEIGDEPEKGLIEKVNNGSQLLNNYVYDQSIKYINAGKIVGIVGGEHSVPYGLIKALATKNEDFGILHIDAHADLREAYEGFIFSHASIMYNVIKNIPQVSNITQVAIRDFCNDEYNLINNNCKLNSYTDRYICECKFKGETWLDICSKVIADLPEKIYISFDIDGLSPDLCPNTGTPVPGGLSYREANFILDLLVKSNRKIIGFDLCEVGVSKETEWDANVGSRVLFRLCQLAQMSNK